MKTRQFYTSNFHPVMILLPILASLTMIISSCTFNVPAVDPSKRQTDVSRSVESTLNAEKVATYQAQQTQDAGQPTLEQPETPDTNATIQAQQATLDAQSTSLSPQVTLPAPSDTPQVAPTLAPGGLPEPVQLLDWKMGFWIPLSSGCNGKTPCWKTNDDYNKHFGNPLVLTSKTSVLIDSNWPKPYLVFWNKRDNNNPATVEVIIDGTPIIIKQYPKGQKDWTSDAIDLSAYKGKEIFVRFVTSGKLTTPMGNMKREPTTNWYVANIQIFPTYKP